MGQFISWIEENLPSDDNAGDAQGEQPPSLSGMISTLVPVIVISAIYLIIFFFFRRSQRRFYAPRTYLGSLREHERTPAMPSGWFNWTKTFWKLPDVYALQHQGLDAFLFLRFLKICVAICFFSMCITWPILFPINATGGAGKKELEILSYSNIDIKNESNRLYAHTFVAWAVYGFVMYMITRECIFYISVRQAFLLTPQYARRISSRTVLFTCVPDNFLSEARIRRTFPDVVKNVWIAGDTKDLDEVIEERDEVAMRLEKAEIKLLKTVNKERIKSLKKSGGDPAAPVASNGHDGEIANIAEQWITTKQRPAHRVGWKGLFGQKVDTIEWCRSQLHALVPKAEAAQAEYKSGKFNKVNALFVEFVTQSDAQTAFQTVTHHHALHMAPKYIGVKPDEVVWKSLSIPWWQLLIRRYAVYAFIGVLVIFWAIPVGIVGIIAQVATLQELPGLTWIQSIPSVILGVISGLLPSVALAILMSLVPVIMRLCAKLAGATSLSQAELFTQNAYFFFQIVQVFLIRTITDTASTAIVQIVGNPGAVFDILATALPTSSNFYISYFIVQGLTIATGVMTQVVGFVIFKILYKFLAKTPRAMYTKWTTLSAISWGSVMPVYTTIAVISVTYAVIAPLMLFWATLGLGLFYVAFRYNILFVTDTNIETRGLFYPRGLKQLFVGVYLAEICMVGMFAISKAPGPAVLMGLFLVFTILYHISLSNALGPLLNGLPQTLAMEEEYIQARSHASDQENGIVNEMSTEPTGEKGSSGSGLMPGQGASDAPGKKGNFLSRWLKPWVHADYETLRQLAPTGQHAEALYTYSHSVEADAYWPPSATSATPILWIPADPLGLSKQEIAASSKVIPISDEGCTLDEKNKVHWDEEGARPPIWNEKIYY